MEQFNTILFSLALLYLNLSRLGGFFQRVDVAHAWVWVLASLSQDWAIFAMKSCTGRRIWFFQRKHLLQRSSPAEESEHLWLHSCSAFLQRHHSKQEQFMNDGVRGVGLCRCSWLHPSGVGSKVLVLVLVSRGSLELFAGGPAGCSLFVFGLCMNMLQRSYSSFTYRQWQKTITRVSG